MVGWPSKTALLNLINANSPRTADENDIQEPTFTHLIVLFPGKLTEICVESRTNYNRDQNGLLFVPWRPIRLLLTDQRIQQASLQMELGRRTPHDFVMWCRVSVRDTLALVRQGRKLRAYLRNKERAEARAQERADANDDLLEEVVDEDFVATSSEEESE